MMLTDDDPIEEQVLNFVGGWHIRQKITNLLGLIVTTEAEHRVYEQDAQAAPKQECCM